MKTRSESGKLKRNKFTSGNELTEKEFISGIKSAEKGPFINVQESMNRFEEWLKKREKK